MWVNIPYCTWMILGGYIRIFFKPFSSSSFLGQNLQVKESLSAQQVGIGENKPRGNMATLGDFSKVVMFRWWFFNWVFPKIVGVPPKSSMFIGFSIIFTIHFGGIPPIFGNTQL